MTKTKSVYLAVLAVLLSPMAANADVIDFDALTHVDNDILSFGPVYSEDGYTMTITTPGVAWATIGTLHPDFSGSTSIFINTFSTTSAQLTQDGGGTFDILSFDLMEHVQAFAGAPVATFTGLVSGGGTVTQTFTLDDVLGFQTFNFDSAFQDLTALTWISSGSLDHYRMDNIVVQPNSVSVPEPGTLALLGLGLFGMGLARRRRKV